MKMQISNVLAALGVAVLSFGAAACGDDDGPSPRPDAGRTPDASVAADAAAPDAGPDAAPGLADTRAGTIAVAEFRIPQASAVAPSVTVSYSDLATGSSTVVYNDIPAGASIPLGCVVRKFDLTATPPDSFSTNVDEGAVTITGDALVGGFPPKGDAATMPSCTFSTASTPGSYACVWHSAMTTATDTFVPATTMPTAVVTLANGGFDMTGQSEVGMYLRVSGFPSYNGALPVLAVLSTTAVMVGFPGVGAPTETNTGAGGFALVAGAGPIPFNPANPSSAFNFISSGTANNNAVLISKAAGTNTIAIPPTPVVPAGEGFVLATDSITPSTLKTDGTANDFTFTSTGAAGAGLTLTIITGSTTDGVIPSGTPATTMPAPVSSFATFRCSQMASNGSITMPAAAMAAILATNPTRIETRLLRASGTIVGNVDPTMPANSTSVLAGHGEVGFTTVVAATP